MRRAKPPRRVPAWLARLLASEMMVGMMTPTRTRALDVLDGRIQTIRSVSNPDKLRHVGPVADAWAVAREVNQARRPKD